MAARNARYYKDTKGVLSATRACSYSLNSNIIIKFNNTKPGNRLIIPKHPRDTVNKQYTFPIKKNSQIIRDLKLDFVKELKLRYKAWKQQFKHIISHSLDSSIHNLGESRLNQLLVIIRTIRELAHQELEKITPMTPLLPLFIPPEAFLKNNMGNIFKSKATSTRTNHQSSTPTNESQLSTLTSTNTRSNVVRTKSQPSITSYFTKTTKINTINYGQQSQQTSKIIHQSSAMPGLEAESQRNLENDNDDEKNTSTT